MKIMSVDYPGAIDWILPDSYTFNSVDALKIVEHCTGGNLTLESLHATFLATERSTHFGIGRDGRVAQFVRLNRGAGGNCCPDKDNNGNFLCSSFWIPLVQQYGNLNLCTISIEHCNDSNNSLPLTSTQMEASNKLNLWLCQRFNLTTMDIHSHHSINPINKANCPGSQFSFDQLFNYINANINNTGGGTNPHMEKQFTDVWTIGGYPLTSGIALMAKAAFMAHKMSACFPTSKDVNGNIIEIDTVDWKGNAGKYQTLSNGCYAFWNDTTRAIYYPDNSLAYKQV